mgnify:CR=1 FL=1
MLDESYSRIQKDINASHILIKVNQNANDNERKSAFDRALKIKKSIIEGAITFSEAAKKYSDDKSALTNEGNLGYFTAFMMVYNFESAAYKTSINEIIHKRYITYTNCKMILTSINSKNILVTIAIIKNKKCFPDAVSREIIALLASS